MKKYVRLLVLSFSFLSVLLSFQNCGEVKFKKKNLASEEIQESTSSGAAISLVSQTVFEGQSATIEAVISQSATNPSFVWMKDGSVLTGEGDSSLNLSPAQLSDQGSYEVIYIDGSQELGRATAQLTVIQQFFDTLPVISSQPSDQGVTVNDSITLSVSASGSPQPTYQWTKNGVEISGATGTSYSIASAELEDAGSYQVNITNAAGTVNSRVAAVTVEARKVVVTCRHYWSMNYCTKPDGSCFSHNGGQTDNATNSLSSHYGVPKSNVKALNSFSHSPRPGWNPSCGSIGGWRQWEVTLD